VKSAVCARASGKNFDGCLHAILRVAVAISGSDEANIQLLDPEAGVLTMAGQCGFGPAFMKYFACVRDGPSTCSAAIRSGERIVVEDVTISEIFVGRPCLNVLIDRGVPGVISMPLMSRAGNLLGMISTHFSEPHHPREGELGLVDLLARHAADYPEHKRAQEISESRVREMQHRSNNQIAVIQAIAHLTFSGGRPPAEAEKVFWRAIAGIGARQSSVE
jgi:GAF domain-containing protein